VSTSLIKQNLTEPSYYHRNYANDVGCDETAEQAQAHLLQRVALVSLPFLSLYKPLSMPISIGMGAVRIITSLSGLHAAIQLGDRKEVAYQLLQTAASVAALAGTIFAHPAGMLITTAHDLAIEAAHLARHIKSGDKQKALESCANIINNLLYLALFLHGGLELSIASLAVQILIGLYHSQAEFRNGNYLEGSGHLLMSMIRGGQVATGVKMLRLQSEIRDILKDTGIKNAHNKLLKADLASAVNETKLKSYRMDAYKVEITKSKEGLLHWGYYGDGSTILTVISDKKGKLPD
jgi:hypothetical protein